MSAASPLPPSWTDAQLGEISEVIRGITFPSSAKEPEKANSNVCCLRTTNIQREIDWSDVYFLPRAFVRRDDQLVKPGDVLMSMANSYELVGKVAIARRIPFETAFGAFLAAIRPQSGIDGQYLFHLLRTSAVQRELRKGSSQTVNIANISVKTLSTISVPVAPAREQHRIAAKVDAVLGEVDACRTRLDRVPQILQKFREAVLEAAVSGRLTEDWRALSASGTVGDGSRDLPIGWAHTTFAEITESSLYGPRFSSEDYIKDGVPTLRTTDMDAIGNIVPRDPPRVKISAADFERLGLRDGDLVITRTGATIGKCAVYDASLGPALPSAYLIRFRLRQSKIVPRFALIFLLSPNGQQLLAAGSTSFAQPNINAQKVRTFGIRLPTPLEQTEIVRRVEELFALADSLTRRYDDALTRVEKVTPSVLAKAFRGELVPQDPNDEPAAEMLGRIKEQRKETKVKKKTKIVRRTGRSAIVEAPDQVKTVGQLENYTLTPILRKLGRLRPEALLQSSGLTIDDFYDQLKLEEAKGLLREVKKGKDQIDRWIEAVK